MSPSEPKSLVCVFSLKTTSVSEIPDSVRRAIEHAVSGTAELVFAKGEDPCLDLHRSGKTPELAIVLADSREVSPFLSRFRSMGWSAPCFAIADGGSVDDLVAMLEAGMTDIFLMPVPTELLRAKTLHHIEQAARSRARVNPDLESFTDLTMKEYKIVRAILSSPGQSLSRSGLMEKVWPGLIISPKTVDVHLFNLRRKLRRHGFDIKTGIDEERNFTLCSVDPSSLKD